ncbi:hypothetical protein ZWY2020_032753 [Hordeum vulgare]|nr:hypothetical protein ZWY2020_032753 [Hordeum vulgare]
MGKSKSAAKPPPKKRMGKLDKAFSCPFCNHGSSVECRMLMKNLIGEANCRICQESFNTIVNGIFKLYLELQILTDPNPPPTPSPLTADTDVCDRGHTIHYEKLYATI